MGATWTCQTCGWDVLGDVCDQCNPREEQQERIAELEAELEKENFYARKQKALRVDLIETNKRLKARVDFLETYKNEAAFQAVQKAEREWLKEKRELEAEVQVYKDLEKRYVQDRYDYMNEVERLREAGQAMHDAWNLGTDDDMWRAAGRWADAVEPGESDE